MEMQHDNVVANGWFQLTDTLLQGFQFLFEPFRRSDGRVEIQQVEAFHTLLYLTAANHVQSSVSYACKQIRLSCFIPKVTMIIEYLGEDVVHYICALRIIVQKYGGQPIHLTVMLFEQLLKFLFICHTFLIHTKNVLLNPFEHKITKRHTKKASAKPENRLPRVKVSTLLIWLDENV